MSNSSVLGCMNLETTDFNIDCHNIAKNITKDITKDIVTILIPHKKRAELTADILGGSLAGIKAVHRKLGFKMIVIIDLKSDREYFSAAKYPECYLCCLTYRNLDELTENAKKNFQDIESDEIGVIAISGTLTQYMVFNAKGLFEILEDKQKRLK